LHRGQGRDFFQMISLKRRVQVCHLLAVDECLGQLLGTLASYWLTNFVFLPFFFKKKNAPLDVTRDNDWTCPKCGNINFSFRTVCNMRKCNTPKPGSQVCAAFPSFHFFFIFFFKSLLFAIDTINSLSLFSLFFNIPLFQKNLFS
jgi:hypothetical protein